MLTKEKLSEITKNAIGTFHYTYAVAKVSSQNSFAIRLYDQLNDELVANSYIYEGDKPGRFMIDFVPERSNKTDRVVLRDIIGQLYEYFDGQLKQKYYIKMLNTDYGYLTRAEGTDSWNVTSLKIAKMSNQKATFTAVEIGDMQTDEAFANVNLWRAAEEVDED
jgi:hypothetical protein|nr:MAG TPA: hypothetical protein [Caudoviricetes sp.]